jgi:N6-L-threonylcarbamoyladenine synthase
VLEKKLVQAARTESVGTVVLGGGVAANRELRARTTKLAGEHGLRAVLPELASCTDNAAMIAYAGAKRLERGDDDTGKVETSPRTSLPRVTTKGRGKRSLDA